MEWYGMGVAMGRAAVRSFATHTLNLCIVIDGGWRLSDSVGEVPLHFEGTVRSVPTAPSVYPTIFGPARSCAPIALFQPPVTVFESSGDPPFSLPPPQAPAPLPTTTTTITPPPSASGILSSRHHQRWGGANARARGGACAYACTTPAGVPMHVLALVTARDGACG